MALKKKKNANDNNNNKTDGFELREDFAHDLSRSDSNQEVEEFKGQINNNNNISVASPSQDMEEHARDKAKEQEEDKSNIKKRENHKMNSDNNNNNNTHIPKHQDDNDGTSPPLPPPRIELEQSTVTKTKATSSTGTISTPTSPTGAPATATAKLIKHVRFSTLPAVQDHHTRYTPSPMKATVWGKPKTMLSASTTSPDQAMGSYRSHAPSSAAVAAAVNGYTPAVVAQHQPEQHQQGGGEVDTLEYVENKLRMLRNVIASQADPHERMLSQLQQWEDRRDQLIIQANHDEEEEQQQQGGGEEEDEEEGELDEDEDWVVTSASSFSTSAQSHVQSEAPGMSLTSVGMIDDIMLAQISFGGLSLLGENVDDEDQHAVDEVVQQQEQHQQQHQQQPSGPWHPRPAFSVQGLEPSCAQRLDLPCELRQGSGVCEDTKVLYNATSRTYIAMPSHMPKHVNRFGGVRKVIKCEMFTPANSGSGGDSTQILRPVQESETESRTYALKWFYKSKLVEYAGRCMEDPIFEIEAQLYLFMEGHTHVLPLHGLWEDEERIYVLSKYMARGSVHDYLSTHMMEALQHGRQLPNNVTDNVNENVNRRWSNNSQVSPWSFQEKLYVFRNMLLAISECHKRGIAHLDVSCENFVLANDFTPFLIDFGLATTIEAANSGTRPRAVGKKHYMAPECWNDTMPYDARKVDAWAVAVCLVMLLTNGVPPFGEHVLSSEVYKQVVILRNRKVLEEMLGYVATPVAVVDLLFAAFVENPNERIGCEEMLRHPIFQMHTNF